MKQQKKYYVSEIEAMAIMTVTDTLVSISDENMDNFPELEDAIDAMYNLMSTCYRDLNGAQNEISLMDEYEAEGRENPDELPDNSDEEDDGITIDIENPEDVPDDTWGKLF